MLSCRGRNRDVQLPSSYEQWTQKGNHHKNNSGDTVKIPLWIKITGNNMKTMTNWEEGRWTEERIRLGRSGQLRWWREMKFGQDRRLNATRFVNKITDGCKVKWGGLGEIIWLPRWDTRRDSSYLAELRGEDHVELDFWQLGWLSMNKVGRRRVENHCNKVGRSRVENNCNWSGWEEANVHLDFA